MPLHQPDISSLPPFAAGDAAYRLFCDPAKSSRRTPDHAELCRRSRYHLRNAEWQRIASPGGEIQTYAFLPVRGPSRGKVLLVHGWTGEASFMTAFVEPLRRSGFTVLLFDFPAHGLSARRTANLSECARAMLWTCDALGPIDAVVAHSFGGVVSLWVGEGGPPLNRRHEFQRYVLISCPNRFTEVTRDFSDRLGLNRQQRQAYERRLERVGHRQLSSFSAEELAKTVSRPILLIHANDDFEVPFENARQIASASDRVRLEEVAGLGHRNILFAPPIIRMVLKEISAGTGGEPAS